MAREINLVPDIKGEMIKALKLRNFIFFLCIVVAASSVGVTVFTGLLLGGQQLALTSKQNTINNLSNKLNSYSDLTDFLTIKDQLGSIATLTSNKKVLSRTFNILSTLIPTGADTITISELTVNLSAESPTFTFDAQANAGKEPFIDYNVLDAFKKSMQFMRYDYGHYVDKDGNTIPAYCLIETADDGSTLNDSSRGLYAYWTIHAEGCNPSAKSSIATNDADDSSETASDESGEATNDSETSDSSISQYEEEEYGGQRVVRIWRTPQFNDWYKAEPEDKQPYMSLDGSISNVPHFVSECISYKGEVSKDSINPKWSETNDSCLLVPGSQDASGTSSGIRINDSSNGRSGEDELVLRFSAVISLNPAVYNFNNHHMITIPPSGRRNVTDSYVQVQAMFGERAKDCAAGDTTCSSAPTTDDSNNSDSNSNNTDNGNQNTNGGNQNG